RNCASRSRAFARPRIGVIRRGRVLRDEVACGVAELCSARNVAGGFGNPPRVPIMKMLEPPEMDADMRSVIDAARGGHEPNEMARARVRRGVELRLAAGLALAVGPTASAFASAAKVTVAVVAIGPAGGAGVYVYPRFSAKPASRPTVQHVAARPARVEMPAPAEIPAPAPAPVPSRPHVKHHAPVAAPPVAVENVSSLKEETALLGAANAAL